MPGISPMVDCLTSSMAMNKLRHSLSVALTIVLLTATVATAKVDECQSHFYQHKQTHCVDAMVQQAYAADSVQQQRSSVAPTAGFLAFYFMAYPQEMERLLLQPSPPHGKIILFDALWRASLFAEAQRFAQAHGLTTKYDHYVAHHEPAIGTLQPKHNPADNDRLIGAYAASGNTVYIKNILHHFTTADEAMVHDALRIALAMQQFGSALAPKERTPVMLNAACEKYDCKKDNQRFSQVMTLVTAYWALNSLSKEDEGVEKTLSQFFDQNTALKRRLDTELMALNNYKVAMVAFIAKPDHSALLASLNAYETLQPAEQAFEHFKKFVEKID